MINRDGRRQRQIETQVPPWRDPWRRGVSHHYESLPPIGALADHDQQLVEADLGIVLCPLHLHEPMELRAVYFAAKGFEQRCKIATALYRAQIPPETKSERIDTPGLGVVFRLVAPLGVTSDEADVMTLFRHTTPADVVVEPALPMFLAFMVAHASDTTVYTPHAQGAAIQAFLAGAVAEAFNRWPAELTPALNTRARLPFFVLRSATGVKLYGDPVTG